MAAFHSQVWRRAVSRTVDKTVSRQVSASRLLSQRGMRAKGHAQRLPSPAAQLFPASQPPRRQPPLSSPRPTPPSIGIPGRGGTAGKLRTVVTITGHCSPEPAQALTPCRISTRPADEFRLRGWEGSAFRCFRAVQPRANRPTSLVLGRLHHSLRRDSTVH